MLDKLKPAIRSKRRVVHLSLKMLSVHHGPATEENRAFLACFPAHNILFFGHKEDCGDGQSAPKSKGTILRSDVIPALVFINDEHTLQTIIHLPSYMCIHNISYTYEANALNLILRI